MSILLGSSLGSKKLRLGSKLLVYLLLALVGIFLLAAQRPTSVSVPHTHHILDLPVNPDISTDSGMPIPWSVSYSPYTALGACKPVNSIAEDLHEIQSVGISTVRLFSSDCHVLSAVDRLPNLHFILGIHPFSESDSMAEFRQSLDSQLDEITDWGHWDRIDMLVVGSQGVFAEAYTRAQLVKMIRYVREEVSNHASFHGLITTSEPVQSWLSPTKFNAVSVADYKRFRAEQRSVSPRRSFDASSPVEDNDLCAVVDAVGLVVQPYFNSQVEASNAGQLVSRDVRFAKYLCSDSFVGAAHSSRASATSASDMINRVYDAEDAHPTSSLVPPVVVLEAGWPTDGEPNGHALASAEAQKVAIESLVYARNPDTGERVPVSLYSFRDELWRDPGELAVEVSFGIHKQYL